jgi:RNA-dependent RNA polymerase
MEIDLNWINHDANVYDVRKSIELVLHGPDLYDPNDRENNGRKPNFQVVMGLGSAGRLHNGTAILRVTTGLGLRFLQWIRESDEHNVVVCGYPLRISNANRNVPLDVKLALEKALYIGPDQDRLHAQKEGYCGQVRLRIAKIQFGVWYRDQIAPPNRAFSIEYEQEVLHQSAAYIAVAYEQSLIRIDVSATLC